MIDQYMTPLWMAESLVERHFGALDHSDVVLEPSCGRGAFLQAIPAHVPAMGVEEDPALADEAVRRTGRVVVVGDFRTVSLDIRPTVIIGNPPFRVSLIREFLDRAHVLLPDGGRLGFILPAYAFKTARTTMSYSERWSIGVELIPMNAFHKRMVEPLVFAMFAKDAHRVMVGLALYREAADVQDTHKEFRELLTVGRPYKSAWRAVVDAALEFMGGEASLAEIYRMVEGARPTGNPFWKEKVRQIVQDHCTRTGHGRYARAA